MEKTKPRNRVIELAEFIRLYKINRKQLAREAGVSYSTIRSLDDGANVTVKTFEAIEAAITNQRPDGDKTCESCLHRDVINDDAQFDFCNVQVDMSGCGQLFPLKSNEPCIAWRKLK